MKPIHKRNKTFKIFLIFIFLILSNNIFSQTDWERWEKSDYSYQLPSEIRARNYSLKGGNVSEVLVNSVASAYWFFISDVDGYNCSFRPSCSAFLVESVKETNLFKGTVMFFDRFTRDMNFYKKVNHYPRIKDGHFYDPINLYKLDEKEIKYIPSSSIVKN